MTQTIINLGTGGSVLNGQNGSTSGADSNDALFLDWDGQNYVYQATSGTTGNYVRSVNAGIQLDIVGDYTITVNVALPNYASGAEQYLAARFDSNARRIWSFSLNSAGRLQTQLSTTGSGFTSSQTSVDVVPVANGTAVWLRAAIDVNNGASGHTVTFYYSLDGITWESLGSDTDAGAITLIAFGEIDRDLTALGRSSGLNITEGYLYRCIVSSGLHTASVPVVDIDTSVITSGAATSFTALTGQTINILRATSGRKNVAVVNPVWLFGTDDYMEVADNNLLDFGATDSFTIVAAHRPWATQGTDDTLIAKKANTTNTTQGYSLSGGSSTALQGQAQIGDGTAGITAVSGSRTSGQLTITAAVRNVTADNVIVYLNGTAGSAVTDTTTGSLSNAEVLRIARLSDAGTEYADMELVSVAVFRRALTATEIAQITAYYQSRLS
jgi:hypothetical protein